MANESRKIILAVTGGIAAYKAADLCSKLVQSGAAVRVAFSRNADKFISPLVFEALSGHPVYRQVLEAPSSYQMEHISWARWADTLIIAPASASTIARMAHGIADDPITTLYLAFKGRVYLAPAMNTAMYDHCATQANLQILKDRDVEVIDPGSGSLACGETGSGRMAEPLQIMSVLNIGFSGESHSISCASSPKLPSRPPDTSLEGTTVLITSGPTREYIDPVRFISNPSSGKMGLSLAHEAMRRGAHVHFVTGPVDSRLLPTGNQCTVYEIETAREMLTAVQNLKSRIHLFIFVAAVGDFRSAQPVPQKIKRTGNSLTLPLVENPDIAQAIGFSKLPNQVSVGFAAETNNHESHGREKIDRKHFDAIVINDVSNPDIGFQSDENEVKIIVSRGETINISKRSKVDVAFEVLEISRKLLHDKNPI